MAQTHRYAGTDSGHDIELEFDKRRVVVNKATLRVDGEAVDSASIVYGEQELRTTLEDGTDIVVALHSGMLGELTRAQLKQGDGSWRDLAEG